MISSGFQYMSYHKLTLLTEIKIIRKYYEHLYAHQLDNPDEMEIFVKI